MTTPSSTSCRQCVPMCPDVSLQPVDIRCFSTSWSRSALHGIQHLGGGHHEFAYQIANRHQLERLLDSKTRTLSQFDPCTNHAFEIALVDDHLPQRKQRIHVICFMMPVLVLGCFRLSAATALHQTHFLNVDFHAHVTTCNHPASFLANRWL